MVTPQDYSALPAPRPVGPSSQAKTFKNAPSIFVSHPILGVRLLRRPAKAVQKRSRRFCDSVHPCTSPCRASLRSVPNGCPAYYSYHPDTRPDGPAELFQFAPGKLVVEGGSNLWVSQTIRIAHPIHAVRLLRRPAKAVQKCSRHFCRTAGSNPIGCFKRKNHLKRWF